MSHVECYAFERGRTRTIPERSFVWSTETWSQQHAQQSGKVRSYDAEPLPRATVVRRWRPCVRAWTWGYVAGSVLAIVYGIIERVA